MNLRRRPRGCEKKWQRPCARCVSPVCRALQEKLGEWCVFGFVLIRNLLFRIRGRLKMITPVTSRRVLKGKVIEEVVYVLLVIECWDYYYDDMKVQGSLRLGLIMMTEPQSSHPTSH